MMKRAFCWIACAALIACASAVFLSAESLAAQCGTGNEPAAAADPDYVVLLQKRLAAAEKKAQPVNTKAQMGVVGGNVVDVCNAGINVAAAKSALYQATGETKKVIEALEEKLKLCKERAAVWNVVREAASPNYDFNADTDAQFAVDEAEYELKKAKKPAAAAVPDYVVLLQKRLAAAEKKAQPVNTKAQMGVVGGNVVDVCNAGINVAAAKSTLYQATGETKKVIEALEEKLKLCKERAAVWNVRREAASPNYDFNADTDAQLAVDEAEYELKKAKKPAPPISSLPLRATGQAEEVIMGRSVVDWQRKLIAPQAGN